MGVYAGTMRFFTTLFVSVYRFAAAIFCFAGTMEFWLMHAGNKIVYFTYQTNIALGVIMLWAGAATLLRGVQPPAWLKGCLTLYIVVTGLVAWLVLPPSPPTTPVVCGLMTTTMAHVITPIMAVIDFVLFDAHRRFAWHYALTWLIYLPVYLGFVLVRAHFWPHSGPADGGSPYPYGFIDLPALGWTRFGINIGIYLGVFFALGLLLVIIDRILPAKTRLTIA